MIADLNDLCKLCRLCLTSQPESINSKNNIFTDEMDGANKTRITLKTILLKLFQIEYKEHPQLPQFICQQCFEMVEKFYEFQQSVQNCERMLLYRFMYCTNNQPGLNGNPGVFEPDENCVVTEIDPEQDCESSEEFSMESDSDVADVIHSTKSCQSSGVLKQQSLSTLECKSAESTSISPKPASSSSEQDYSQIKRPTYMCQYCDAAFATQADCLQHENHHDLNTPYVCHYCSLSCTNRHDVIAHIREVHDCERPYICTVCTKGFARRADLKKHTIVHTGIRPFACPICCKDFSRRTNLTKHMLIHEKSKKPFSCRHCPRLFNSGIELLRHLRCHNSTTSALKPGKYKTTNNRVHSCGVCNKLFIREMDLQRHRALHLDTLFKCTQCGKGFNRREKLSRHQIECLASKLQCYTCHLTFPKIEELDQHVRMHGLLKFDSNISQSIVANAEDNIANEKQKNTQEMQLAASADSQPSSLTSQTRQLENDPMPTINLGFYSETNLENCNYIR